jgi:hypothetical protein
MQDKAPGVILFSSTDHLRGSPLCIQEKSVYYYSIVIISTSASYGSWLQIYFPSHLLFCVYMSTTNGNFVMPIDGVRGDDDKWALKKMTSIHCHFFFLSFSLGFVA